MQRKLALGAGVALVLGFLAAGIFIFQDGPVDCGEKYNQTIQGDMEPDKIPTECRPLPEEVREKILARTLADS